MKQLLIIMVSITMLSACRYRSGSGHIVTEKRNVSLFTAINVGGGFEVELQNGPVGVTVESDDNIIKFIQTKVSNGELKIRLDHTNLHDAHLKVYVTAPSINHINVSASATVDVKDVLRSDKQISLNASSGGEIKAVLDAPGIKINASSAAELRLSGRTRDIKAVSSSGATINAKDLMSEEAIVNVSSGASVNVHASISLDVTASSGGKVSYRGEATLTKSVSSGGSVEKD